MSPSAHGKHGHPLQRISAAACCWSFGWGHCSACWGRCLIAAAGMLSHFSMQGCQQTDSMTCYATLLLSADWGHPGGRRRLNGCNGRCSDVSTQHASMS